MRNLLLLLCFISLLLAALGAIAQNGAYSWYYNYSITNNPDGSVGVTPTAEVTGIDDVSDWIEGSYRPVCTVRPKIQLSGDPDWVGGTRVALGRAVDQVRTGQALRIPINGADVGLDYSVEVDVTCSGAPNPNYYRYPGLSDLWEWSAMDLNFWYLAGFVPAQTGPPYWYTYCTSAEICPVSYGVASIKNFVDFADFLALKFRSGYDNIWYDDPDYMPPFGPCAWSVVPNCQSSGVVPQSILNPFTFSCSDGAQNYYVSVLDTVPWVEVQIGNIVKGTLLSNTVLDKKYPGFQPALSCSASPPHLGVWR